MTFSKRQPKMPQSFPKAVLRHEPGLQFGKRRVRFARHTGAKNLVMRGELGFGAPCPRMGTHLSRWKPPPRVVSNRI